MSEASLKQELRVVNANIDAVTLVFKEKAKQAGVPFLGLQNPDGSYIIVPLLAAKAQVLSALAYLEKK